MAVASDHSLLREAEWSLSDYILSSIVVTIREPRCKKKSTQYSSAPQTSRPRRANCVAPNGCSFRLVTCGSRTQQNASLPQALGSLCTAPNGERTPIETESD